jgi:hypothetical protein
MTTLVEMAHALRALDPVAVKPIEYGLHEDNSAEGVYVRACEDYGWSICFTYECGPDGVEITFAELVGRGSSITVPLSFFESKDLDMVAEEIQVELNEKHRDEQDDPGARGDFEYEGWKDKQMLRAQDAYIEMAGDKE